MEVGFIYILSNPSIPNLVKIGFTLGMVEERAKQLYVTGVPSKFVVEYSVKVVNPRAAEKVVHRRLESLRENKEWFACNPLIAIKEIQDLLSSGKISDAKLVEATYIQEEFVRLKEVGRIFFEMEVQYGYKKLSSGLGWLVDFLYKKEENELSGRLGVRWLFGNHKREAIKLLESERVEIKQCLRTLIYRSFQDINVRYEKYYIEQTEHLGTKKSFVLQYSKYEREGFPAFNDSETAQARFNPLDGNLKNCLHVLFNFFAVSSIDDLVHVNKNIHPVLNDLLRDVRNDHESIPLLKHSRQLTRLLEA